MATETGNAKNPCPGALMRKRRTWPPIDPTFEIAPLRFNAPRAWQPQPWALARPVRAS